jgi:hypothetical protein
MTDLRTLDPTERYEILVQRVARATETVETYLAAHIEIPEDVQERYDRTVNNASDYAAQWGFDIDIDVVA